MNIALKAQPPRYKNYIKTETLLNCFGIHLNYETDSKKPRDTYNSTSEYYNREK